MPFLKYEGNQKLAVANLLIVHLVTKNNQTFFITFGHQQYNGPMATKPLFDYHPMALHLQCLGPNFLRCTTKDKRDLVFNGVLFCPIF